MFTRLVLVDPHFPSWGLQGDNGNRVVSCMTHSHRSEKIKKIRNYVMDSSVVFMGK